MLLMYGEDCFDYSLPSYQSVTLSKMNKIRRHNDNSLFWMFIPYLRVYHIENYVIHHHVVLNGGSHSKNADLKFHLFLFKEADVRYKTKTPACRVVRVGRSLAGIRHRNPPPSASDSSVWCQQVISLLAPPDSECFPLVHVENTSH